MNVIECTLGCQYISVTLYLLQTYPSGNQNSLKTTVGRFFMVGRGEGLGRGGLSKNNIKIQNVMSEVLFQKNIISGIQIYKKSITRSLIIFEKPKKMTSYFFDNYIFIHTFQ